MSWAMNGVERSERGCGVFKATLICAVSLLLTLVFAEIGLRFLGFRPWRLERPNIAAVEPGGAFYSNHETLGFALLPGKYKVTLQDGYSFETTHLPSARRATSPAHPNEDETVEKDVWVFGCSFTYGFLLDDEETFPWLLQEKFPEYRILNFGVTGYGTLHSYIQFLDALKERPAPEVVVIVYASFHDVRNTLSRKRRKLVAPYAKLVDFSLPYAVIDVDDNLGYMVDKVEYREAPLMRYSALAHFLERAYNKITYSTSDGRAITERIVREMNDLSEKEGAELVVVGITDDPMTAAALERFEKLGIPTADISVDLSVPEHTNKPHDEHPSALANRLYASKLESFLRKTCLSSAQ